MPFDLTATIPQSDLDELSRMVRLRSGYLHESMLESTLWAAWFVARAAGAATVISKKRRKVIKNPQRGLPIPQHAPSINWWPFVAVHDYREPNELGYAYIPIDAQSIGEARASSKAQIRDYVKGKTGGRGLARAAWAWLVGRSRKNHGLSGRWPIGRNSTTGIEYQWNDGADTASVTMHNRLRYASDAMKSENVPTIISRGANAMRKDLERRAKVKIARAA